MARHSGGAMVALLSDIEVCVSVTVIAVAPIAAFTCSGLSSNPASSRSTRGRGIIVRVVVVGSALPVMVLQPAVRMQMAATASVAIGWRKIFLPIAAVSNLGRDVPAQRGA